MEHQARTRPSCTICGQLMGLGDRAPQQRRLPREFVCWNVDCTEFGIYKQEAVR